MTARTAVKAALKKVPSKGRRRNNEEPLVEMDHVLNRVLQIANTEGSSNYYEKYLTVDMAQNLMKRVGPLRDALAAALKTIPQVKKIEVGKGFVKSIRVTYRNMIFSPEVRIYRAGHGDNLQPAWALLVDLSGWRSTKGFKKIFRRGTKDFSPKLVAKWLQTWLETNFDDQRAELDDNLARKKREDRVESLQSSLPPNTEIEASYGTGYKITLKGLTDAQLDNLLTYARQKL